MDYRRFLALRKPFYDEFELGLGKARSRFGKLSYQELESLAGDYRQLLHDHAWVQARYPGTSLAHRLKHLVLDGTLWLQRDTGEHLPTLGHFFRHSFPAAMRSIRPMLYLSVGFFLLAGVFGLSLTVLEPALGVAFLGPEARQGLAQGELWTESVFALTPGSVASAKIATNNLGVAIGGWVGGMLAGLLGFYVLLINGLMLGSVIGLTAQYSMTPALFEFIAAHGPLEISMILVTVAAGFSVGLEVIAARDVPRSVRLKEKGRDALLVLLGCLPWILVLGFVEGFISPDDSIAFSSKVLIGLILEMLFIVLAIGPWWQKKERAGQP